MAIPFPSSLMNVNGEPLDSKTVVANITERNAIPVPQRYRGMQVTVKNSGATKPQVYWLPTDDLTNTGWQPLELGGGDTTVSTWASGAAYIQYQLAVNDSILYRCLIAHTSTTFAADATKWEQLSKDDSNFGVPGWYEQVSGTPANEFEFNDIQTFLNEKINGKTFLAPVGININFDVMTSPTFLRNVIGRVEIWADAKFGGYLYIENVTSLLFGGNMIEPPSSADITEIKNCGSVELVWGFVAGHSLTFKNCPNVMVESNVLIPEFTIDNSTVHILDNARITNLYTNNSFMFIKDTVVFTPVPALTNNNSVIIDDRPGRPIETYIRKVASEYAQDTEYKKDLFVYLGDRLYRVKDDYKSGNTASDAAAELLVDIAAGRLSPVSVDANAERLFIKGKGGTFTQGTNFTDLIAFLKSLENKWFNESVYININSAPIGNIFIQNMMFVAGGRFTLNFININGSFDITLSNVKGNVEISGDYINAFGGRWFHIFDCDYIDIIGRLEVRNLNISNCHNARFMSFSASPSYIANLSIKRTLFHAEYGKINIEQLNNDGLVMIVTNDFAVSGAITGSGQIIDTRAGRPLETFIRKQQDPADEGKILTVQADGKVIPQEPASVPLLPEIATAKFGARPSSSPIDTRRYGLIPLGDEVGIRDIVIDLDKPATADCYLVPNHYNYTRAKQAETTSIVGINQAMFRTTRIRWKAKGWAERNIAKSIQKADISNAGMIVPQTPLFTDADGNEFFKDGVVRLAVGVKRITLPSEYLCKHLISHTKRNSGRHPSGRTLEVDWSTRRTVNNVGAVGASYQWTADRTGYVFAVFTSSTSASFSVSIGGWVVYTSSTNATVGQNGSPPFRIKKGQTIVVSSTNITGGQIYHCDERIVNNVDIPTHFRSNRDLENFRLGSKFFVHKQEIKFTVSRYKPPQGTVGQPGYVYGKFERGRLSPFTLLSHAYATPGKGEKIWTFDLTNR